MKNEYRYNAVVTKIIDGDTFDMTVDLGFNVFHAIRVRLHNIDTAELRSRDKAEVAEGLQAKAFVIQVMPPGTSVVIDSVKTSVYNRWEAIVYVQHAGVTVTLAELIIAAGFDRS